MVYFCSYNWGESENNNVMFAVVVKFRDHGWAEGGM